VTVTAVLKGDSRIAFDAAIEDAQTDPNAAAPFPLTADHVEESLCAVATIFFPFHLLDIQKQWMNKYMKKPYGLSAKMMLTALSRINNYLPSNEINCDIIESFASTAELLCPKKGQR
jgi:hypothetical protein